MEQPKKKKQIVNIPNFYDSGPSKEELSAAKLLAKYFDSKVKFVKRNNCKTPDFLIGNSVWELKSPTGSGKHNVQHNLQDASNQSKNVVFDGRKSKIHPKKLKNELQYQLKLIKKIKRLVYIDKSGRVVEIFRKK